MIQVPTLNFILKKSKPLKDGTVPIYLRVTLNGTRTVSKQDSLLKPFSWFHQDLLDKRTNLDHFNIGNL